MTETISREPPHFPEVGIIAMVPGYWGRPWMPREHVLTRLAKYFHVAWVDEAHGWRERLNQIKDDTDKLNAHKAMPPNFLVCLPVWYQPHFYRLHSLALLSARLRLRRVQKLLRERGCRRFILYLWRPKYAGALNLIDYDVSCYHIDDEYSFSNKDLPVSYAEKRLIERVDQVIIHSPALMQKKGRLNANTIYIPNGVDYRAYSTPQSEPVDMAAIPYPRIGYIGIIKKQLDFQLLLTLAERHPQWSFVFVGPKKPLGDVEPIAEQLAGLPNVYMIGGKTVDELPAYAQHLDVLMMCYKMDNYTKYIYPMKLHEYLASGRPTVGTPISSLLEFKNVVELASTADEWSQALTRCLAPTALEAEAVARRQDVAKEYDWDMLSHRIAEALCVQLGEDYQRRFTAIDKDN